MASDYALSEAASGDVPFLTSSPPPLTPRNQDEFCLTSVPMQDASAMAQRRLCSERSFPGPLMPSGMCGDIAELPRAAEDSGLVRSVINYGS